MKKSLILVVLWAGVVSAQPRSWGFERDTIREWDHSDVSVTVRILNNGTDTLRLQTLILEGARPTGVDSFEVRFAHGTTGTHYQWKDTALPLNLRVPPQGNLVLRNLQVEGKDAAVLVKAARPPARGDSVLARLRFLAAGGTEDTLYLSGVVSGFWTSALRLKLSALPGAKSPGVSLGRDARGRALTPTAASKTVPVLRVP